MSFVCVALPMFFLFLRDLRLVLVRFGVLSQEVSGFCLFCALFLSFLVVSASFSLSLRCLWYHYPGWLWSSIYCLSLPAISNKPGARGLLIRIWHLGFEVWEMLLAVCTCVVRSRDFLELHLREQSGN